MKKSTKMEEPLEFHSICYDKDGQETTNEKDICAKELTSNRTGNKFFVIKSTGKELYNPTLSGFTYAKRLWKFIKVDEHKFNLYLQFLKYKHTRFLTQAERIT